MSTGDKKKGEPGEAEKREREKAAGAVLAVAGSILLGFGKLLLEEPKPKPTGERRQCNGRGRLYSRGHEYGVHGVCLWCGAPRP